MATICSWSLTRFGSKASTSQISFRTNPFGIDAELGAVEAEFGVKLETAVREDGEAADVEGVAVRVGVVGAEDDKGVEAAEEAVGVAIDGFRRAERECLDEVDDEPDEFRE